MSTKYSFKMILSLIALTAASIFFVINLQTTIQSRMHKFSLNETLTVTLDSEQKVYVLYQRYYINDFYDVTRSSIYSRIEFNSNAILFLHIKNMDDNDLYYLDGFGESTSIKINDYDALGTATLQPGTYEITMSPASNDIPSDLQFAIINSQIFVAVFNLITSGLFVAGMLVLFFILLSKHRNELYHEVEFDGDHYEHADINALFDQDDPYGDQYGSEDSNQPKRRY